MTRVLSVTTALALLSLPSVSFAQEEPDDDEPGAVIRAPRAAAGETLVNHLEIERTGATTLADVLRVQGDVDSLGGGAPGAVGRFTLRGAAPEESLLLIDGVRLSPRSAAATVAGADPNLIPAAMIQRMSILRGPSSAWLGPNAVSGAVTLTTREPASNGFLGSAQYGSFESFRMQLSATARQGRNFAVASATANTTGGWAPNTEASLFGATLKLGRVLPNGVAFVWMSAYDARTGAPSWGSLFDADTFDADDRDLRRGVMTAGVWRHNFNARDTLETSAAVGVSRVTHLNPVGDDLTAGGEAGVVADRATELQSRVVWNRSSLRDPSAPPVFSLGAELGRESLDSSRSDLSAAVRGALFARTRLTHGIFTADLAARLDLDTQYGAFPSPRVAFELRPSTTLRTYLSVGGAFRPPTFSELSWPTITYQKMVGDAAGERGNASVSPETAWGIDAGFEAGGGSSPVTFNLRPFGLRTEDFIRWQLASDGFWTPTNLPLIWTAGVSADVSWRLFNRLTLVGTALLQRTLDADGNELDGRLRHKLTARAQYYQRHGLRAWVEGLYFERSGVDAAGARWQGFFLNARAGYEIGRAVSGFVAAENLLDTRFESVRGLPTPGRTLWVGISLDLDED